MHLSALEWRATTDRDLTTLTKAVRFCCLPRGFGAGKFFNSVFLPLTKFHILLHSYTVILPCLTVSISPAYRKVMHDLIPAIM